MKNKLIIPKGGLNVLSLFDGMSCGQVALQRAGIPVKNYFAAEIDKHAMKVTQSNFPNTIFLGDVTKIHIRPDGIHVGNDFFDEMHVSSEKIDLLIGGSPCQGFSFAGKQLNFDDPRSKLFFEFVRLLDEAKPRFFFLENVKMKKEFENIITETLLVEPIEINSNLVSAQNRKRLYWTNILGMEQPKDRGILMKDIVHEYNDELYAEDEYLINPEKVLSGCEIRRTEKDQVTTINPRFDNGKQTYQQQRVYETDGKSPAISAELNGRNNILIEREFSDFENAAFITKRVVNQLKGKNEKSYCLTATSYKGSSANGMTNIEIDLNNFIVPLDKSVKILEKEVQKGKIIKLEGRNSKTYYIHNSEITLEESEGIPYLLGCITPDRVEKRQNGQRFNDGRKFYTLTAQDQHGILIEGYIRKLTPVECERLQTLPDNYSAAASKTQRYKMCGNGWTVDVIVEFFKLINITNTIQT